MVTRYGKEPPPSSIHCFMPSYPHQLRLFPTNPPSRGEPPYHMNSGGQGMRSMHHSQPQQPPTPPTQPDMKSPAALMQTQQMHPPPQPGQASLMFSMNARPNTGQQTFYRPSIPGNRPQQRPAVMMNQQQFMQGPQIAQFNMNPLAVPYGARVLYPTSGTGYGGQPYFNFGPMPQVRPPPMPNPLLIQHSAPTVPSVMTQPQELPSAASKRKNRPNALKITDPNDGHDILEAMIKEEERVTPSNSGESSARETPQLVTNNLVASEFARKVASTLGDEIIRPGSRNSTFSESEPPINTELPPNIPREVVTSPKLDGSADVIGMGPNPGDVPLQENNVNYGSEAGVPRRWGPLPVLDHIGVPVPMHHPAPLVVIPPMHPPPTRDFQPVPTWPQEATGPVMPPVGMSGPVPSSMLSTMPPQLMKKPEQTTPVVSALAQGRTVDISRDFPVVGGQRLSNQQSPMRTKRRMGGVRQEADIVEPVAPPPVSAPVSAPIPVSVPVPISVPVPEVTKMPTPSAPLQPDPVPEILAPVEPVPTPSPPAPTPNVVAPTAVDAKVSHQKGKSNKRQNQRQEQQRQATPPPAPVTVVAPAVEDTPVQSAFPAAVEPVKFAPQPLPTQAAPIKEPTPPPTQLPPKVTPVVDEKPQQRVSVEKEPAIINDNNDIVIIGVDRPEDRLVAAMNEENDKLTASKMLPTIPQQIENNNTSIKENNNVDLDQVTPTPTTVLKHQYTDEQWSPLNVDGKKQYGRDFIMQLQHDPQSKKRPDNLPNLEVLKDSRSRDMVRGGSMSQRMGADTLMPSFLKTGGGGGSMRGSIGSNNSGHMKRSSQHGKQKLSKPVQSFHLSLSLSADVKLRECETPWKPSRVSEDSSSMTDEEKKTDLLYKKVRGVLNRLTPQKFHKLVDQVRALPIDTIHRLQGVIDLVFLKAVDEPGYSVAYAQMCAELAKLSIEDKDKEKEQKTDDKKPTPPLNFRVLILQRCQMEFEKDPDAELKKNDRLQVIADEPDPEKKKELTVQLEEDERRLRVKSVGNIRFIGELYKLRMLTIHVMLECIDHLLRLQSEESYECLCKLLTTIGKSLEDDIVAAHKVAHSNKIAKGNNAAPDEKIDKMLAVNMNKYFEEFKRVVKYGEEKKTVSSRVRFMFMDLIDLRENNWTPRRNDTAPKTMDQIAKEAEREQLEQSLALSSSNLDNKRGPGRMNSRNSTDNRSRGGGNDNSGGWQQVNHGNTRKQYVETIKLRAAMEVKSDLVMGNREMFTMWGQSKASEPPLLSGITQNKFAVLEEKPQSRSSSLKGPEPRERPPGSNFSPSLQDKNRNSHAARSESKSKSSSRDSSLDPRSNANTAETPVTAAPPPIDADLNATYTASMLLDYLTSKDLVEVRKIVDERFADSCKSEMINNVLMYGLEKTMAVRCSCSKVLSYFLQTGAVSQPHFFTGFSSFLEQADDLKVDIPRLWEYTGELLADIVGDGLPIKVLIEFMVRAVPESDGPMKTVASILKTIHAERPTAPCLSAAVPTLRNHFAAPQPYQAFIKDHSLEFLETEEKVVVDESRVTSEITLMLRNNAHFDSITQWVDANVGPASTEPAFVRALTNALLDFCLVLTKNVWRLDTEILHRHLKLMSRYVDNTGALELQCLFAIQAKMTKLEHPKGVLCDLCQFLSDQGVISSDSFKLWRSSKDTQNMEGRGVCMASLTSFFTMIDEDEDDPITS